MTSSFTHSFEACQVLSAWRESGPKIANELLCSTFDQLKISSSSPGALLLELKARLNGSTGPRILIDGIWLSRPFGGITRVWEQILSTWSLPGLVSEIAPVALIDRDSQLSISSSFSYFCGSAVDPLDFAAVGNLAADNYQIVERWNADVFCSSWISSSGVSASDSCQELALVHDCLPERSYHQDNNLINIRRRWLRGASSCLAVSASTAFDVEQLLSLPPSSIPWCHPAPARIFSELALSNGDRNIWSCLKSKINLPDRFIVLPATSKIGSYKNPEFLAEALLSPSLSDLSLLVSGIAAEQRSDEIVNRYPRLRGRLFSAGFSDLELAIVYKHALAVVIPSRIEGFGLPAIEVMAAGGLPLIADVRGLREAGGEAALRFSLDKTSQLTSLLEMLIDPYSRDWVMDCLSRRIRCRLTKLHPDLIGLILLAEARRLWHSSLS